MRIHVRNCVTDPKFKDLRRKGKPVFKPILLGQVLLPGAVRVMESSLFARFDVEYLHSLVKSGSCTALEVGVGPVEFDKWLSTFTVEEEKEEAPVEDSITVVEKADEQPDKDYSEEEEEEEEEALLEDEGSEDSLPSLAEASELKSAELRDLISAINPELSTSNKSKKQLIAMYKGLLND